jgi:two-component system NarL family sensor kinase
LTDAADHVQELLQRVGQVARDSQGLLRELVTSERRFRALAKAVWQVQEEERRRLARELHDGLGQDLTALKNQLETLAREAGGAMAGGVAAGGAETGGAGPGGASPDRLAGRLSAAVELAARALQDTRELSRLLRPPILDDLGLVPALSWLARTLRESTGLEVHVAGYDLEGRLPPDLEILIFRVAQEALTNTLKHSGANLAVVTLRRRGGWLELEVVDSGRGFDADQALSPAGGADGCGLRGMRDRLELFGGRLRIASAPEAGTRVRATVPLPPSSPSKPPPAASAGGT